MATIRVLVADDSNTVRRRLCEVFGMPREAITLNATQIIAPLANVAETLGVMARRRRGEERWP